MLLTDGTYKYATAVSHQGVVIAFAARTSAASLQPVIGYSVLVADAQAQGSDGWTDFTQLTFPTELRPVGMRLITLDMGSGGVPVSDAPFQILSDGLHVHVFRQSAAQTLLVDRFVFDALKQTLVNTTEVRYRRSRSPDLPESPRDTFGPTDMMGATFVEPTTELTMIGSLSNGCFNAALLPTSLPSVNRWQIFAYNSADQTLDSYSLLQSSDGLFDVSDAIDSSTDPVTVPPNARFTLSSGGTALALQSAPATVLYARQEQLIDANGQPLLFKTDIRLMLAIGCGAGNFAILDSAIGQDGRITQAPDALAIDPAPTAGTALAFDASAQTAVTIPSIPGLSSAVTVEAWATLSSSAGVLIQSGNSEPVPFTLALDNGAPVFAAGPETAAVAVQGPTLDPATWYHLAGVWDGTSATVYVNGQPYAASATIAGNAGFSAGYVLGGGLGFAGQLDEVRLWNVARTQAEIQSAMCTKISSSDPNWSALVGYWPLDEPSDGSRLSTVPNMANSGATANGVLQGAIWTPSSAPVGLSMPAIAFDTNGLDLAGTLLSLVDAGSAPSLAESGDGLVRMFFQENGSNSPAVARYSTISARANFTGMWTAVDSTNAGNSQQGVVRFVARQAGASMNTGASFIQIAPDPTDAGLCTVTLQSYTGLTESWPGVPATLTAFVGVLTGQALQTSTDPVAQGRDVLMYDYTQVVVTAAGIQQEPQPGPGCGSGIFNVAADSLPTNGLDATVAPTTDGSSTIVLDKAGVDCRWLPSAPPATLMLDQSGAAQYITVLDAAAFGASTNTLNLVGNACVEAWVNPAAVGTGNSTLFCFAAPAAGAAYTLGLTANSFYAATAELAQCAPQLALPAGAWSHVAANYATDYGIRLSGTRYLDAGSNASLDTVEALTVEGWVKLDQVGIEQTVMSKLDSTDNTGWSLSIGSDDVPVFSVTQQDGTGTATASVRASTALSAGVWYCLAGVYDTTYKRETAASFAAYAKGYVTIPKISNPPTSALTVEAWINWAGQPVTLQAVAAIFWGGTGASQSSDWSFLLSHNMQGGELAFIIYDSKGNSAGTATGGADLPVGGWAHIACTLDASGALALYLNGQLLASGQATVPLKAFTQASIADVPTNAQLPLNGLVNEVRLWNVALSVDQIRTNMSKTLVGDEPGLVGYWPLQDRFGTTAMDRAGVDNGTLVNSGFTQVDKGQFIQSVFVNGQPEGSQQVTTPIVASKGSLRFGSGVLSNYLQGTLDELRLWKVGRWGWELALQFATPDSLPQDSGLIGAWYFERGKGAIASDSKGHNDAAILDTAGPLSEAVLKTMWVPTQFKAGWTLYVNGVQVQSVPGTPAPSGVDAQCTLGATLIGGAASDVFAGAMAELRVWDGTRSTTEIEGQLYAPLTGVEPGLIGYWPVNAGSGSVIADLSAGGNNGVLAGAGAASWSTNGPPVGADMPSITVVPGPASAASGLTTSGAPTGIEYGSMDQDASGHPVAALNRVYVFSDMNMALNLVAGFFVGELDTQYVGQVQTQPTVTGYIEGAPPLPSENLTVDSPMTPYKYLAASAITVNEAKNTTMLYSSSRDKGFDQTYDVKFGGSIGSSQSAGIVLSVEFQNMKFALGVRGTFEHRLGWLSQGQITASRTRSVDKTIEVFGAWQENTYKFDTNVPRLYVPNNKGYALVKSGTADLFALRMKGTGALVAYSMLPSKDVPEDVNVIMFALNPTYVKNGTLDGWVGFEPDQNYQGLQPGMFGSYFKPLEAYALKQQIEREQKQLKTYYDQFDAGAAGREGEDIPFGGSDGASGKGLTKALMALPPVQESADALMMDSFKESLSQRSLVNTYVWNSDGGLYAEQEQVASVMQESKGGSYEFVGKGGVYAALSMLNGVEFSLDALWGGHNRTQVIKTKEEGDAFGLTLRLPGEGFLNARLPDSTAVPLGAYPVPYSAASCAGKVNQYRLMTFYLTPSKANFDTLSSIIDPDWLNGDNAYAGVADPDAFTLRQALANSNEVWRVLHRVTYVNRIAATGTSSGDGESLPPSVRQPDADSETANALLLANILPAGAGASNPMQAMSLELGTLLTGLENNALWGAALTQAAPLVRGQVMAYIQYAA